MFQQECRSSAIITDITVLFGLNSLVVTVSTDGLQWQHICSRIAGLYKS